MDKTQLTEQLKRKQMHLSMAQEALAKQTAEVDRATSKQRSNNDPALDQVLRGKISDWEGRVRQTQNEIRELQGDIQDLKSRLG